MSKIKNIKIIIYIIMSIIAVVSTPNVLYNFFTSRIRVSSLYLGIQMIAIPIILEMILYEFLTIIRDIELKDTFNVNNLKIFKRINCYVWSIVIMRCIIKIIEIRLGDDIELVYLLVLALFTQILSCVFLQAYKLKIVEERLKEENELTI